MKGYIEIFGLIKHKTDRAILFDHGEGEPVWIPLSQIENMDEELKVNSNVELLIPEWLANEKGMI